MFSSFDRIDHKVLAELDRNSRQSFSQIAKKLRLGSDLIAYRVERYRREEIIGRFSALVDPLACGWWIFKNYFKLETSSRRLGGFLRFLEKYPATYWLAELNGRFDVVCNMCAGSPSDCEAFQNALHEHYGNIILEHEVCVVTSVTRLSRKYLLSREPHEYLLSRKGPPVLLNAEEVKLLNLLYDDARTSAVEIGESLNISPAAVRYRIEQLEERGVILAYRFQFNFTVVGLMLCKLLLQLADQSEKFNDQLNLYCREHPKVTDFIRQLGRFPVEIEIEVEDYAVLNQFIEDFRLKFDTGIRSCEVVLIKNDLYHRFPATAPGA